MNDTTTPKGKGFFIEGLAPSNLVERATWLGCGWMMMQTSSMEGGRVNEDDALRKYADELRAAGIEVWLWGWPMPGESEAFIDDLLRGVEVTGARGFVLDMEKVWMEGQREEAAKLVQGLRDATQITLGLSSYGAPRMFPDYPWEELSELDMGLPQIYDADNKYGDGFPQRCLDDWKRYFDDKPLIPTLGVNSTSAERMRTLFADTPIESDACSWWSFRGAISENDKAEALRDFQL